MKIIIDIPEIAYEAFKKWHKNKVANVEQSIIANGTPYEERPHGECNQCRYYDGVHGVQGHAPCSFWGIGGVLWSDYCSMFEKEGDDK